MYVVENRPLMCLCRARVSVTSVAGCCSVLILAARGLRWALTGFAYDWRLFLSLPSLPFLPLSPNRLHPFPFTSDLAETRKIHSWNGLITRRWHGRMIGRMESFHLFLGILAFRASLASAADRKFGKCFIVCICARACVCVCFRWERARWSARHVDNSPDISADENSVSLLSRFRWSRMAIRFLYVFSWHNKSFIWRVDARIFPYWACKERDGEGNIINKLHSAKMQHRLI